MQRSQAGALAASLSRGDERGVSAALGLSHGWSCLGSDDEQHEAEALLLAATPDGSTALHRLATGEQLGPGGGILWAAARQSLAGDVWPSRHQRARAHLLAALLQRCPRLALLAAQRNASGDTPVHCAVLTGSLDVLAALLAALQRLLPGSDPQAAAALQLLLSVPNAEGLAPVEVALQRRQWAAAHLLACAARGGLPLSQSQLAACALVQRYIGGGGGWGRKGGGAGAGAGAGGLHVSASGSSMSEALGGLLSKLWDALGSSAAAADARGSASAGEGSSVAGGGGRCGPGGGQAAVLEPRPVDQAGVMALIAQEEQQALDAAHQRAAASGPAAAQAEGEAQAKAGSVAAPPGGAEHAAAAAGAAEGAAAATLAVPGLQACIVCYEELPPGWLHVRLPCSRGHPTCDACWRGILLAAIDEGDTRRAACPQPGCGAALPASAAPRLLAARSLQRFQLLRAQQFAANHPATLRSCPRAGCGTMLSLWGVAGEPAPAAQAPAAAKGAGLDAVCAACSHRFCWRCGEEAHEPAACSQMHEWEDKLAELRRAAPNEDRAWLKRHAKRCPHCKAHIEKHGGCNHMRCGCGHHFCWECGRDWAQHSTETGGFYFCSLQQREDLPDFDAGGAGGAGSLLGGPLSWLAGAWASIRTAAAQQQLAGHLRQFLKHSGGREALAVAGAHMRLVLGAAGGLGGSSGGEGGAAGEAGAAAAAAAATPPPGVDLLCLRPADASRISPREWADLMAAAAASAADAAVPTLPATLPAAATRRAAEAAVAAALRGGGGGGGGGGDANYLQRLAAALADARSLLQHSAAALCLLPSGPARRHLQAASASLQRRVEALTPLLLALPEREELPAPPAAAQEGAQAAAAAGAAAGQVAEEPQQQQQQQQQQQRDAAPAGSGGGLAGWLLRKLYGVEVPAAGGLAREQHRALGALPPGVLLQQAQFASAVHQQRARVRSELAALEEEAAALRAAARSGLYSGDGGGTAA